MRGGDLGVDVVRQEAHGVVPHRSAFVGLVVAGEGRNGFAGEGRDGDVPVARLAAGAAHVVL
jgi:hypothetical protein